MARKMASDPRLQPQKSALKPPPLPLPPSLESTGLPLPLADPLGARVNSPPTALTTTTIAPYDPRILSAGGAVGGRGGTGAATTNSSVLSGISLYDPRTAESTETSSSGQSAAASSSAASSTEPKKPSSVVGGGDAVVVVKAKPKEPLFVRKSALDQPEPETVEPTTDRYNSYNRPRIAQKPPPMSSGTPGGPNNAASSAPSASEQQQLPAGVHNLPVSASLFHMVKQAGKTGSGSPYGGNSPAQPQPDTAEQDAASLKDVFKGFDPTASPFCQ